ncbi:MAG: flagellar basal body rod protein FlgC [Rhodobacter sp.]|uniref:flagellar basal body rod protein FlgC n=1 Tax=Pararhodobacter sp. TaxID=2127056 RepID=UPI001D7CF75C|nr:flagellar basal body rod protein FlgC [Pararhodobacter sp.]MCB1346601.1 flagellar basal body rod protein FlgC [Paracoccaceae bacterium]MCC0072834.1 flagellar basal body rod protein FlgC [Rhodobacter sp.]HPD90942.1 flagellar basal body rod protein FlgC [Pararhodobacter sp.]
MSTMDRTLALSASGMQAQAMRLRHVSENIANADTPGYRRKTIAFEPLSLPGDGMGEATGVRAGRVSLDRTDLTQIYDPGNILADETGHYLGSNVDVMVEIADAREAQRSYEANLRMFDQARQMSQSLIGLLRR